MGQNRNQLGRVGCKHSFVLLCYLRKLKQYVSLNKTDWGDKILGEFLTVWRSMTRSPLNGHLITFTSSKYECKRIIGMNAYVKQAVIQSSRFWIAVQRSITFIPISLHKSTQASEYIRHNSFVRTSSLKTELFSHGKH